MKRYIKQLTIFSALILGLSLAGSAQIVVRVRPTAKVVVRPVAPSPRHVWIDGGWVARGNRYVYVNGYWAMPRRHQHWVDGHWERRRGGWVWVPGYWVRGHRGRW